MRLQNYLTEAFNMAFFISPRGEIVGTPQTHIQQVITKPEKFGFNDDIIDYIYNFYSEPKGLEGKAREQILISLLNQGWIRLRRSKNFWTAQLKKLDGKSRKHISQWAGALLDGKLGYNEIDPYVELKIIDIKGRMESSGLKQLQGLTEDVDISDIRVYEISELDDRPILKEYQYITELFDAPVENYTSEKTSHDFKARWTVTLEPHDEWDKPSAYRYMFQAYRDDEYRDDVLWAIDFARDMGYHQYDTTKDMGQKEAMRVFAGVKKAFLEFVREYNPKYFWWSAEDKAHAKVYDIFSKHIKQKLGYNYQTKKVGRYGTRYNFWKIEGFVKDDPRQLKLPGF
jgi:hypothetical protein